MYPVLRIFAFGIFRAGGITRVVFYPTLKVGSMSSHGELDSNITLVTRLFVRGQCPANNELYSKKLK